MGWPFSMMATHEFVVPKSMPMIFAIVVLLAFDSGIRML